MKHARRTLVAGLIALVAAGLVMPPSGAEWSPSSFGSIPRGHRALYDLLVELGLCAGRSLEAVVRLPARATVWWIEPAGVCDARIAHAGGVDILDSEAVSWPARDWVEAGGTAVVFLGADEAGRVRCDAIANIELPGRRPSSSRSEAEPLEGRGAEGELADHDQGDTAVVSGSLTPSPRRLAGRGIVAFEEARDWFVAASVLGPASPVRVLDGDEGYIIEEAVAAPFVLERRLGAGRLVVVADSGFTHNASLDSEDAALLAVDLVRRYGIPLFDEREHGFVSETSAVRYLASSPAWSVFAGLFLLGALFAWWGTALPVRSVEEFDPETPTLATFVDSMAALYARSRDHSRLFERYRELTAARLRRHFGMSREVSIAALAERIERDRRTAAGALRSLTERRRVEGERELFAAAHELDELVREVTR